MSLPQLDSYVRLTRHGYVFVVVPTKVVWSLVVLTKWYSAVKRVNCRDEKPTIQILHVNAVVNSKDGDINEVHDCMATSDDDGV